MDEQRRFLTDPDKFIDVSRGNPVPHTLKCEALARARLTPDTWRLEITAEGGTKIERTLSLDDNTAIDLSALHRLGQDQGVRFLKAMQCNNITLRVRTVAKNGFAQPEPRPVQQSGLNRIQCKQFIVMG